MPVELLPSAPFNLDELGVAKLPPLSTRFTGQRGQMPAKLDLDDSHESSLFFVSFIFISFQTIDDFVSKRFCFFQKKKKKKKIEVRSFYSRRIKDRDLSVNGEA